MKKKLGIITIVIVAIIIAVIIIMGKFSTEPKLEEELTPSVEVATVTTQEIISTLDAYGTIVFRDEISVYSRNEGKVDKVLVEVGDYVKKGDVIVTYDNEALENMQRQLDEAKLSLKSAQISLDGLLLPPDDSQLRGIETQITQNKKVIEDFNKEIDKMDENIKKAKEDLEQGKVLYAEGAISLIEYEKYETVISDFETAKDAIIDNIDIAKEQLETTQIQYQEAQDKTTSASSLNMIENQKIAVEQATTRVNELTKDTTEFVTKIVAEESGTIIKVVATEGMMVTSGAEIVKMGNLDDLIVQTFIPEYDMKEIKVGQEVNMTNQKSKLELTGEIIKVYPIAEKQEGLSENSVKVEISIEGEEEVKAGYTLDLNITTKVDKDALVIPIMSYMTQTGSDPYVFVVNENNILEKRLIQVVGFQYSVVSIEGLEKGEVVVLSPTDRLDEGVEIIPIGMEEPPLMEEEAPASNGVMTPAISG